MSGFFWEYTSDLKCYLVEKKKEISWNASACLSLDRTSLTFWPRSQLIQKKRPLNCCKFRPSDALIPSLIDRIIKGIKRGTKNKASW